MSIGTVHYIKPFRVLDTHSANYSNYVTPLRVDCLLLNEDKPLALLQSTALWIFLDKPHRILEESMTTQESRASRYVAKSGRGREWARPRLSICIRHKSFKKIMQQQSAKENVEIETAAAAVELLLGVLRTISM